MLAGSERAIVTDVPGTTRDLITEIVDVGGVRITLVDTAGRRTARDVVEAEGIARSHGVESVSELILIVVDGSTPLDECDLEVIRRATEYKRIIVSSKCDLLSGANALELLPSDAVLVSAVTGFGIDELRERIVSALGGEPLRDEPHVTNLRHIGLMSDADTAMRRAEAALSRHRALCRRNSFLRTCRTRAPLSKKSAESA